MPQGRFKLRKRAKGKVLDNLNRRLKILERRKQELENKIEQTNATLRSQNVS